MDVYNMYHHINYCINKFNCYLLSDAGDGEADE